MDHDRIIKVTNRVALYSTVALFYWVFVFLVVTAFDLKIFREHMTQIFYLSLFGLFSILGGAIVLNVMSNLSKISTVIATDRNFTLSGARPSKTLFFGIVLSFPLIAILLFTGNHLSAEKKKNMLISSAQSLISENRADLESLADYQFSRGYAKKAEKTLGVIKKIDKYFPEVLVILPDRIDDKNVFLSFGGHIYVSEKEPVEKAMFIYSASRDERAYLDRVFSRDETAYKFSSRKGNYELYFPVSVSGKRMVLYFSDYQRYGKFGS